jgi:dihydroorotate dehydrogenase (NAD+) catalytic subunit
MKRQGNHRDPKTPRKANGSPVKAPSMAVTIGRLKMVNPVMVSSGCFGYGEEISRFYPLNRLGAVVVKGTTLEPRLGNPPPRMAETPGGMLNAIGLQNVGVDVFLKDKLPFLRKAGVPCVVNINGRKMEEYVELARRLEGVAGIGALEINISCPNVKEGGIEFGSTPEGAHRVVSAVRKATKHTLITKLSPNVTDVRTIARACVDAGSDALSAINTVVGMAIDARTRRPMIRNVTGGLSGPAVKPIGLRVVFQVAKAVKVPLIGMGGIVTGEDAVEYLLAGATAVSVGTANYLEPKAALHVVEQLEAFLKEQKVRDVKELIGGLQVPTS